MEVTSKFFTEIQDIDIRKVKYKSTPIHENCSEATTTNTEKNNDNNNIKEEEAPKRKSKDNHIGRDYICTYCDRSYFQYSSLYIHLKSKHNITKDKLKNSYVRQRKVTTKELQDAYTSRFSLLSDYYSIIKDSFNILYKKNIYYSEFIDYLIPEGKDLIKNPINNSTIRFKVVDDKIKDIDSIIDNNNFYKKIVELLDILNNNSYEFCFDKINYTIDEALATFFIIKILSSMENFDFELFTVFLLLIREFMNLYGPIKLEEYKILTIQTIESQPEDYSKEYCSYYNCSDFNLLLPDFYHIFLSKKFREREFRFLKQNLLELSSFLNEEIYTYWKIEGNMQLY